MKSKITNNMYGKNLILHNPYALYEILLPNNLLHPEQKKQPYKRIVL